MAVGVEAMDTSRDAEKSVGKVVDDSLRVRLTIDTVGSLAALQYQEIYFPRASTPYDPQCC